MRIEMTVTVPDDPALAAGVLRGIIPDLGHVADSIAEEIRELKPGQYGWTADPDTQALRLHWSVRDGQGRGYVPPGTWEVTGSVQGDGNGAFRVSATDGQRTLTGSTGSYDRAHELLRELMDQLRPAGRTV
jgi:hypothetical protein